MCTCIAHQNPFLTRANTVFQLKKYYPKRDVRSPEGDPY